MRKKSALVVVSLWFVLGGGWAAAAGARKVLLVHLRWDGSGPTIAQTRVIDGRLKNLRSAHDHEGAPVEPEVRRLVVSFLDAKGRVLYEARVDDPLEERLEYITESGELRDQVVRRSEGSVLVRAPLHAAMSQVRIRRVDDGQRARLVAVLPLVVEVSR